MIIIPPQIKSEMHFIDVIIDVVCNYYETDYTIIVSRARKNPISQARNMAIHFSRLYTRATWVKMEDIFCRTPTTMLGDYRAIEKKVKVKDRRIFSKYVYIKQNVDSVLKNLYPLTWDERIASLADTKLTIIA